YLGKLIDRSESHFEGKMMCSTSFLADSDTYITNDKPSDALYTMLLSIKGVEVVLFFKELSESTTEVGFRASHQSHIDVGALAESFGGGGHKKAAGATVQQPLEVVRKNLLKAVENLI
ncbi:MAG: recombinase RecJ, partial [Spirochaetia bacterium]|nr:recombinase RecJ [Spirochaetia bacterium]